MSFLINTSIMNKIVSQAKTWVGTKFHHQGRIKKTVLHDGGVDCLGLIIEISRELNLYSKDGKTLLYELDTINYGHFPDTDFLYNQLSKHLIEIPSDKLKAGDIVIMNFDNHPQHLAIVSNYMKNKLGIIHSYAPAKKVIEHRLDDEWKKRIEYIFSLNK